MIERAIAKTGEMLPVVGCGTWLGFDVGRTPGEFPRRGEVLDALFAAGGRTIDSSPMYGSAEQVVGDLLDGRDARGKAFLATKVWTTGRDAGIAQMERSMQLLRTPHIDLMQVHNLQDWRTHMKTMVKWKDQGRFSYIGVTHYSDGAHGELASVMREAPVDFVQFNYSLLDRNAEHELLPLAQDLGIAVIVNLPFGGGREIKRLRARPLPEWAAEIGCASWNQVALKFVLSQRAVTCVIPGTSDPVHMRENAAAGAHDPPDVSFWGDKLDELAG
jgi:aryl-alcohol dehydrogenase-like predicted oxidoreductase